MSYQNGKPPGSPTCWGTARYQDGDQECTQCPFRGSCRPTALSYLTQGPPQQSQAMIPLPQKFNPFYPQPAPTTTAPPQPQVFRPPVPNFQAPPFPTQFQPPMQFQPPPQPPTYQFQPQQQQLQPYQPQQQNFQMLDFENPHPYAAMYRPGAAYPPHYFTMHPGETVGGRLVKNLVLRALEMFFMELSSFFRHWVWPKRG